MYRRRLLKGVLATILGGGTFWFLSRGELSFTVENMTQVERTAEIVLENGSSKTAYKSSVSLAPKESTTLSQVAPPGQYQLRVIGEETRLNRPLDTTFCRNPSVELAFYAGGGISVANLC